MKIYVCERSHDNDCGLFGSYQDALEHWNRCWDCAEIMEYDLTSEFSNPVPGKQLKWVSSKLEYCQRINGDKAQEINHQEKLRMFKERK